MVHFGWFTKAENPAKKIYNISPDLGCRHSSVDSSAPSILLPRVRVPSTPSMLFSIYICHLNWNVKRMKINKKRPGLAHFFLKKHIPCEIKTKFIFQNKRTTRKTMRQKHSLRAFWFVKDLKICTYQLFFLSFFLNLRGWFCWTF